MKRVSVDIGGTFTDCVVLEETGQLRQFKSPTIPATPSRGLLDALGAAARFYDQDLDRFLGDVDVLIHGTTLATNTLLTGQGARTGLITTRNFRDVIQLRRGIKNLHGSMFDLFVPPYQPLVRRQLRLGVTERISYRGEVLTPLNEDEVRDAARHLRARGVEAIAVCFLHSYANPVHEARAAELCRELGDGLYVTTSHETLPVLGEFERFNTTTVGACIGPVVADYLAQLERELREAGFRGRLLMMLANGLVQTVEQCLQRVIYLLGSGPAAAPAGALEVGRATRTGNLLSVDMGGTSFDVCLVRDGAVPTTSEGWIGEQRVAIKMVDIHSVGAGGGSIAWIDPLGLLRVGPRSAGADPGPACYGRGSAATVTDADLVLGYIPHDFFLGGQIALDRALAERAIGAIGDELGMGVEQAAAAIFTTVNTTMAGQITEISTRRGHDVRDFTMVAGGGASGIHAAAIAELLEIPEIIVPAMAGAYSAFGMFALDLGQDHARSLPCPAATADPDRLGAVFQDLEAEALRAFTALGFGNDEVNLSRTAELRYLGQFHQVEVPFPGGPTSQASIQEAVDAFHRRHEELFLFSMPGQPVEFLTFRLQATVPRLPFQLARAGDGSEDASPALKRPRPCWFHEGYVETPVYDGRRLRAGNRIVGPGVIEEPTTTVVVPPGFVCEVDPHGSFRLRADSSHRPL